MGCGAMYLIGGIVTHIWVRENFVPAPEKTGKTSLIGGLKSYPAVIWTILILCVVMGLARRLDEPYVPMLVCLVTRPEKAVFYTGMVSLAAAAGGLLSGIVVGKLSDRFSPALIAIPATILSRISS